MVYKNTPRPCPLCKAKMTLREYQHGIGKYEVVPLESHEYWCPINGLWLLTNDDKKEILAFWNGGVAAKKFWDKKQELFEQEKLKYEQEQLLSGSIITVSGEQII